MRTGMDVLNSAFCRLLPAELQLILRATAIQVLPHFDKSTIKPGNQRTVKHTESLPGGKSPSGNGKRTLSGFLPQVGHHRVKWIFNHVRCQALQAFYL